MSSITTPASSGPAEANLEAEGMSREVGLLGLMWASEGSIIGSGWLFGALTATSIAGPSALIAWGIASVIVIILALVHAELGGLFPVTGGTSRFPHYAFGSFAGATFGWFAYIQAASVAPIEVLGAIQYASNWSFASSWYKANGTLSGVGILVAIALMLVFVVANMVGIRWLSRLNNTLTTWKILIPVAAIIILMITSFHSGNFTAGGGFFVKGSAVKDILVAVPGGGIVFALLGFEQAVQLGGESSNPKRDLPRAVIGSILIGVVIYVLVQVAFIAALSPGEIITAHGWTNLATPANWAGGQNHELLTKLNQAPFASVAAVAGLAWFATILKIDAVISPSGTGLIYLTTASRISFGLSKNGYIPEVFEKNSSRKIPVFSIIVTAVIGLLFLLPFPSWSKLVGVVTSASVLMYAGAPLALGALRRQKPELPRAYRLPMGEVLAPLSFVLANFIVYWSGWGTYTTLMLVILIGFALMAVSFIFKLNPNTPVIDWQGAIWVLPYLVGLGIISYLGPFGTSNNEPSGIVGGIGVFKTVLVGGHGDLPLYWDMLVLAVFSLAIYYLALAKRLPSAQVDRYVAEVYPPPVAE
jgi:amino acid transporter